MSGVSLATKGMICGNGLVGVGTMGRPASEAIVEAPIINVIKVKTKVINVGIDLFENANITFKVDKVLSSY